VATTGAGATFTAAPAPLILLTPLFDADGDAFFAEEPFSSSSESGPLESSDELLDEDDEDDDDNRLLGEGLEEMACLGGATEGELPRDETEIGKRPGDVEGA